MDGGRASTGDDGVTRWQHEGRVFRWQRAGSAWPGHVAFVALRAGEVVLGDRYAGEGVERTYTCEPQALLEGCFHAQVTAQLGASVLQELLAELRRELGGEVAQAETPREEPRRQAEPTATEPTTAEASPASIVAERSPNAVRSSSPAVVSEHAEGVDVEVVTCASVGLPLLVALRGITRAPVQELLERLRTLPCTVLAGVGRAEAERAAEQLSALGAAVQLRPAA